MGLANSRRRVDIFPEFAIEINIHDDDDDDGKRTCLAVRYCRLVSVLKVWDFKALPLVVFLYSLYSAYTELNCT